MSLEISTTGLEQYAPGGTARLKMLVIGGPGAGKGFAPETPVLSPAGWTSIGQLVPGDDVVGSDGRPTSVVGVYPRGVQPFYRLTFSDGATIDADADHLWAVRSRKGYESDGAYHSISTAELAASVLLDERENRNPRGRFYVPLPAPIEHDKLDLPVSPYTLGVLLANGTLGHGNGSTVLTTNDTDVVQRVTAESPELTFAERTVPGYARRWIVGGVNDVLRDLQLFGLRSREKFVPNLYKIAHVEARRDLLAGLMDCDGSVTVGKQAKYHTTSPDLARDIVDLVRSLGGTAKITSAARDEDELTVVMKLSNVFSLPRKAERHTWSGRAFRFVTSVEQIESGPSICIKVAAIDELFVVDQYLVTHNTRMASYWPKPIYADCEAGLASVADRKVPYASIKTSQDMLELLDHLRKDSLLGSSRRYETLVVDTLDAFQRKIKEEWISQNKGIGSFKGYEAWDYLDQKMQMLLTQALNLDINLIINIHFKEKTVKDGDQESQHLTLQLQGNSKDNVFNDFDMVGWLGTYYEAVDGVRTKKRGLTFQDTPERPFLKDRLFVTPPFLEVTFSDDDYVGLFNRLEERITELEHGEVVDEAPDYVDYGNAPTAGVVTVGRASSGPLPPMTPGERPLEDWLKPELTAECDKLGIAYRSNTVKAELIAAIQAKRVEMDVATKDAAVYSPEEPAVAIAGSSEGDPTDMATEPGVESGVESGVGSTSTDSTPPEPEAPAPADEIRVSSSGQVVNAKTGEIIEDDSAVQLEDAVSSAVAALGGEVISEAAPAEPSPPAEVVKSPTPEAPSVPDAGTTRCDIPNGRPTECEVCNKDLHYENKSHVTLAFVKHQRGLCSEHYLALPR